MATYKGYLIGDRWENTVDYVTDPDKSDWRVWQDRFPGAAPEPGDPVMLIQGIHCDPWTAKEEFRAVHRQFGRESGNRTFHVMVSFKGRDASPWDVQRLGMELIRSRYGDRYQAVVATHLNTPNLHFHAAVNTVPFTGGVRIHGENPYVIRYKAEELTGKYGIENVPKQAALRYAHMKERETLGYPTARNLLRHTVDALIPCSRDLDDLFALLERAGYRYYVNGAGAWVTVRETDGKSLRLDCLGPDYLPDALRAKIRKCRENRPLRPPEWTDPGWKQYPFPRREDLLAERTGADGLWLRARCASGYLPLYKTQMGKIAPLSVRVSLRDIKQMREETEYLTGNPAMSVEELTERENDLLQRLQDMRHERNQKYGHYRRNKSLSESERETAGEACRELNERIRILSRDLRVLRSAKKRYPAVLELAGGPEREKTVPVPEEEKTEKEKKVE